MDSKKVQSGPTVPKPERLKSAGDWAKAVSTALAIKRAVGGWPQPDKKKPR